MTAVLALPHDRARGRAQAWAEVVLIVGGAGALVIARVAATRAGIDPLLVGAGFGAALLGLVLASGADGRIETGAPWQTGARRQVLAGVAGAALGLALVGIVIVGSKMAGAAFVPGLARPAAPFAPWAAVTVLVAIAEEAVLRGVFFDRLSRSGGVLVALLATTVLFALLHVPLYGWHVVPLDLAVGAALGGLRVVTRGIVAPAVAHAVADLATWWL